MNKKEKTKLILGSASLFRKKLLEDAGFVFDVKIADIDEKKIRSDDFKDLVLKIALAKMDAILEKNNFDSNSIIITFDGVAVHNGELREKPISKEEVMRWHKEYVNSKTTMYTSVVAHHIGLNKTLQAVDTTYIDWGEIPERVIKEMADNSITYTAAGFHSRAFLHYAKKVEGSIDTVVGVPLRILENFLEELGYFE
ncbi:MAG: Maf family protein [Patescibacteria group bacterium]